ncbi:MAG: hypothetical protein ACLT65_10530, partial [Sutterella wadsworthensis]
MSLKCQPYSAGSRFEPTASFTLRPDSPKSTKNLNLRTRKPKDIQFFLMLMQNFAAPSVFDLTHVKVSETPAPRLKSSRGARNASGVENNFKRRTHHVDEEGTRPDDRRASER